MKTVIAMGAGLALLAVIYAVGWWKGKAVCREAAGKKMKMNLAYPAGYLMALWYEKAEKCFSSRGGKKIREGLGRLLVKQDVEREYQAFQLKRFAGVWLLAAAGLTIGLICGYREVREENTPVTSLSRPEPGSLAEPYRLEAEGGSWEGRITVEGEVQARKYTREESAEGFETVYQQALALLPGENPSLEQVSRPLDFLQESPVEGIRISWRPEEWEYIGYDGEILASSVPEDGIVTGVVMTLSCGELSEEYRIPCKIVPENLSGTEKEEKELALEVKTIEAEAIYDGTVELPRAWKETEVTFYRAETSRNSLWLCLLGILAGALYFLSQDQKLKEEKKERDRQLLADYPEVLSKLAVLLGAGLTVRNAWGRIVENYTDQLALPGGIRRYVYEEMLYTYRGIRGGQPEIQAYREFGRRCGLQQYRRLMILLEQSLKKGGGALAQRLRIETEEAFSARLHQARRKGEEAKTRLMIPMFLMFILVLTLILVPAALAFSQM